MAKVGKFCLAKRVKVEWLFQRACEPETGPSDRRAINNEIH